METGALSFDKRKHPRIKIQVPVKYKIINQSEAAVALLEHKKTIRSGDSLDVSAQGLFLVCDHSLSQGDILKIEVFLPEEAQPVRSFAEVIWSKDADLAPGKHGAGIFFMALRDEDSDKIKRFVEKAIEGEHAPGQ